jgi:RNA polymerase sigma factor (sigma-70 family)
MPSRMGVAPRTTRPSLQRLDDERLARLSAEDGPGAFAFATLYARHHQALYRYCATIVRDDADAQDALQATWMHALLALRRGQRDAPLRPWLFRIAHNESISVLRRQARGRETTVVPMGAPASAEDDALARERFGQMVNDLRALPERARSALVMRELTGLSHEEIARALRITVGAAKQSVYEARCGLREQAQGRTVECGEIRVRVSDGDRRVLRGRVVRAHIRHCPDCAAFVAAIGERREALRVLTPGLGLAASGMILNRILGGGARGAAATGASAAGAGATGGAATGAAATGASAAGAGATGGAATGAAATTGLATKALGAGLLAKSLAAASVAVTAAGITVAVATGPPRLHQRHGRARDTGAVLAASTVAATVRPASPSGVAVRRPASGRPPRHPRPSGRHHTTGAPGRGAPRPVAAQHGRSAAHHRRSAAAHAARSGRAHAPAAHPARGTPTHGHAARGNSSPAHTVRGDSALAHAVRPAQGRPSALAYAAHDNHHAASAHVAPAAGAHHDRAPDR